MRALRCTLWFIAGMLAFVVTANAAYADTVPAIGGDYPSMNWDWCGKRSQAGQQDCVLTASEGTLSESAAKSAAQSYAEGQVSTYCNGQPLQGSWTWSAPSGSTKEQHADRYCNTSPSATWWSLEVARVGAVPCPNGGTYNSTTGMCTAPQSCPANSTGPVNGVCTCANGYTAQNGQCVVSCPSAGSNPDVYLANQDNLTGCVNGCQYSRDNWPSGQSNQCWPVDLAGYSNNTNLAAYCQMAATGSACPAGATSSSGPYRKCKTGEAEMTINGVTTCTKAGATSSKTGSNTTTQNPDGSSSSESKSKTTTCDAAGNCTTTESTTNGNGTTTTTSQQDKVGFCEENPNSPLCREVEDECAENPDRLSCADLGEVADPGELTKQNGPLPTSLSPVSIAENMSCPADIPLPKGLNFSWQGACDFASGIRPVVLAVAWLTAGLILVGAFRES